TPEALEEWAKAGAEDASVYSCPWSRNFVRGAEKAIPAEWDNKTAFNNAIKKAETDMVAEWAAEIAAAGARTTETLKAQFTLAQARATEDGRKERLEFLRLFGELSGPASLPHKSDMPEDSPYSIEGQFDIYLALADMDAIGVRFAGTLRQEHRRPISSNTVRIAFIDAMGELTKKIFNPLDQWITNSKAKDAPEPEPVPTPTEEQVQEAEQTIAAVTTGDQEINGVTIRRSTGGLVLIGKYNRQTKLPGEWIGLHDPAGFDGPLYAAKDKLKAKYGAKYAKNGNEQFPDSWWFIPASTDIEDLKVILGEKS
ncbi:MAG: hypothetical protein ACRCT2_06390, partial [Plesiomonas shigelloides]